MFKNYTPNNQKFKAPPCDHSGSIFPRGIDVEEHKIRFPTF